MSTDQDHSRTGEATLEETRYSLISEIMQPQIL
jgi:hypothetical protein